MKDFEDVIIEIGMKNLEMEMNRWDSLDNKAVGIIGIAGFLTTLWSLLRLNPLLLIPLILAIFFSFGALWIRGTDMLSTKNLIDELRDSPKETQLRRTAATIAYVENRIRSTCSMKALWLKGAFIFLSAGLMVVIFSFLA